MSLQLSLFEPKCAARYVFADTWRRIFDARGLPSAPLFCSLPPKHEGEHFDAARRIPWGGWRER